MNISKTNLELPTVWRAIFGDEIQQGRYKAGQALTKALFVVSQTTSSAGSFYAEREERF